MHDDRVANLLGAAALAIADLLVAEATDTSQTSASGAAGLVALAAFPRLSVTELGRRIGLSQPATARMVDSLQARELVERLPGAGREVALVCTPRGSAVAAELLSARASALTGVLDGLSRTERDQLGRLLGKVLPGLYERVGNAELLCRLCDRGVCTAGAACPVGQADRDRQRERS